MHAIELRHAPFALWITDLSAPERLFVGGIGIPVMTIIMGGTMLVQQWLTPQQGDPTQRQMMMIMPVVFTFMFFNFPAGLVLYWLVSNLLGITQQYLMLRSPK
jgi:YidC/Oxa1 family membrane protein insertase